MSTSLLISCEFALSTSLSPNFFFSSRIKRNSYIISLPRFSINRMCSKEKRLKLTLQINLINRIYNGIENFIHSHSIKSKSSCLIILQTQFSHVP